MNYYHKRKHNTLISGARFLDFGSFRGILTSRYPFTFGPSGGQPNSREIYTHGSENKIQHQFSAYKPKEHIRGGKKRNPPEFFRYYTVKDNGYGQKHKAVAYRAV